jgi:hypothetical protein
VRFGTATARLLEGGRLDAARLSGTFSGSTGSRDSDVPVILELLALALGDAVHLLLRLCERDARLQPSHDAQPLVVAREAREIDAQGCPGVDRLGIPAVAGMTTRKPRGITPTTTCGRSLIRIVLPTRLASAPKRRCQSS